MNVKDLNRKIRLDKVVGDIENGKRKIKNLEEEISYIQKNIQDENDNLLSLEKLKKNLEKQLGVGVKKVVNDVKKNVKKTTTKKTKVGKPFKAIILIVTLLLSFSTFAMARNNEPKIKIEYDANDNPIYVAKAEPNTSEDLSPTGFWQIRKITYDANDNPTDVKWADGNNKYDNSWANRTNLTYK